MLPVVAVVAVQLALPAQVAHRVSVVMVLLALAQPHRVT
jgi:hypothetical protein